jgi:hypothetical protein
MSEITMTDPSTPGLTPDERRDLRRAAALMIPTSEEFAVPGADDDVIFADIVRSLGRDLPAVRAALAALIGLADLDDARAEALIAEFQAAASQAAVALGRAIAQCYYRDDRVMISLGLEPRPPFPLGRKIEQGDYLPLLEQVRRRPQMWRGAPR